MHPRFWKGDLNNEGNSREIAVNNFDVESLLHEYLDNFQTLKHPNIVEIKGVIQEPEISLVMEFVQHGSLQCYLKIHKESLEHKILLKFALDVAKVCHRYCMFNFVSLLQNSKLFIISGYGIPWEKEYRS